MGCWESVWEGDEGAILELHARYAGLLLAFARREHPVDPFGAVEDLFIVLHQSPACVERSSFPPSTWIVGMALRHFRTCPRSNGRTSRSRLCSGSMLICVSS